MSEWKNHYEIPGDQNHGSQLDGASEDYANQNQVPQLDVINRFAEVLAYLSVQEAHYTPPKDEIFLDELAEALTPKAYSMFYQDISVFNSSSYQLSKEDTNALGNILNPTGVTAAPATNPPPGPGPTCDKDIAILIDRSTAVKTNEDMNRQIRFLSDSLIQTWNIGLNTTEAMAILYAQFASTLVTNNPFKYNSSTELISEFLSNTNNTEPGFGLNSINGGLSYLQSHLSNRRPNKNLTTILFTYSSSNIYDIRDAVAESQKISNNDIIIVAVGNVDLNYLYYLSGTVITADTYFLGNITGLINNAICQPQLPSSPLPPTQEPITTKSSSETMPATSTTSPKTGTSPSAGTTTTASTPSPGTSTSSLTSTSTTGTTPTPSTVITITGSTVTSPTTSSTSQTTGEPYVPCQTWISFSIDDSNTLAPNYFMTQLNFISSAIGTITHPERIQAVGAFSEAATWNSGLTIQQIQSAVTATPQGGEPYNLRAQFAELVTTLNILRNTTVPKGALVFISDTSDRALAGADQFLNQLSSIQLTFVLLGTNVDQNKLTQFSNNFISWKNLSQPQPDNWNNLSNPAYGCTNITTTTPITNPPTSPVTSASPPTPSQTIVSSTTPSSTLTSSSTPVKTTTSSTGTVSTSSVTPLTTSTMQGQTTSTTTTSQPYIPCQSWISFSIDDSNVLNTNEFETQLIFISSAIGAINYPERIQAVGMFAEPAAWNSGLSIGEIQNEVVNMEQGGQYRLRAEFAAIVTGLDIIKNTSVPIGALVFISDTSDAALLGAEQFKDRLSTIQLTFVLLGPNVDSSKLTQFSNNFITWRDLSQPQPDNWNNVSNAAYGCSGIVTQTPISTTTSTSPVTSPSSSTTSVTIPTSTAVPSTSTTSSSPTTTATPKISPSSSSASSSPITSTPNPSGPYIPCQSWISFSYDDSNTLNVINFMTQLSFISSAIGAINHPERIQVVGAFSEAATWNSGLTIQQIQSALIATPQGGPYNLRAQFAQLVTNLDIIKNNTVTIGALIFISDTSDAALAGAEQFINQLSSIQLTFVLLGPNADQNKLTQFSNNFITWRDLSQPQPDNWNTSLSNAYGCTPTTGSTLSTIASSTTSSPTTYYPCNSNIVFAIDASNSIDEMHFIQIKQLTSQNIVKSNWTHFERVGMISYANASSCTYQYGTFNSKGDFDNTLTNGITRFANSNSITYGFETLINTFTTNNYQNTIFFTSTSNPNDVQQALPTATMFDQRGALIIVAVAPDAQKEQLLPLVNGDDSKVIEFNPIIGIDYDTIAAEILKQFYCSSTSPISTAQTISSSFSTVSSITTPSTSSNVSIVTSTTPATSSASTSSSSSSPLTSTPNPSSPYVPCQSWISFSIDDSNTLNANDFKTQLNFISSAIGAINYPERIQAVGAFSEAATWNSHFSIPQIQNAVTATTQGGPYNLRAQFAELATNIDIINNNTVTIGALIFISDTSNAALAGADQFINQLAGIQLTFVLLGPNADSTKLTQFSTNFITWRNLSQPQPDNWNNVSNAAYGCSGIVTQTPISTTTSTSPVTSPSSSTTSVTIPTSTAVPSTSTTSSSPTTTATPKISPSSSSASSSPITSTPNPSGPYIPCQSWISFSYDDSNTLNANDFKTQLNFISSAIGAINYPERIQAVGAFSEAATWNSHFSIPQIQNAVTATTQGGPYNLRAQFAELATNIDIINNNTVTIGALIFISDTSNAALAGADQFINQLAGIQLTFVLLGPNADSTKLTQFSTNFITWRDLSQPQPDNWNNLSNAAYGCSGVVTQTPISTTTGTTPITSQSSSQASITVYTSTASSSTSTVSSPPSTVMTATPQTSPSSRSSASSPITSTPNPSGPYIPCQSWISFSYDDSNTLNANDFTTQLNFISSAIGAINHPERIQALGAFSEAATWNSGFTIQQIQSAVTSTIQGNAPYNLRAQFAQLVTNLDILQNNTVTTGALVFISDTSDPALAGADQFLNQLAGIQLTFILLGPNADSSKLIQFSNNFITWKDLSKPQPDNWNTSLSTAYGCSGVVTQTPISTTTGVIVTSPSSSPPTSVTIPLSTGISSVSTVFSSPKTTPPNASSQASTSSNGASSPLTSTPNPSGAYVPCQSWISFSIDDSNNLNASNFMSQLNFISSAIGAINHPERIQAIGVYYQPVLWNSILSIQQIQNALIATQQGDGPYNLRAQFGELVTNLDTLQNNTVTTGALIFISDTSEAAISGAEQFKDKLSSIQLTFVLLGPNADQSKLTNYSSNFISWRDLSQPQPDNWNSLSNDAYGCAGVVTQTPISSTTGTTPITSSSFSPTSVTISTSTASSPPTTATTPISQASTSSSPPPITSTSNPSGPYIPCQSWISFSIDDNTNTLNASSFTTQLSFISSAIGSLNHPERIQAIGMNSQPVLWNSSFSIQQAQTAITNMQQFEGPYRLRAEFGALVTTLGGAVPNGTVPTGALIFISDTSVAALAGAEQFINQLAGIQLTFVLLGPNADQSQLTQFSNNFITWRDLSQPQPDNWNNLLNATYGCSGFPTSLPVTASSPSSVSPTRGGITIHTIQTILPLTSQSTASPSTIVSTLSNSAASTVSVSASGVPSTTHEPYKPCQSWIDLSYDDSNTLSNNDYKTQMNFISSAIGSNNINYPNRISILGAYTEIAAWNNGMTIAHMQDLLQTQNQTSLSYSLLQEFAVIATNLDPIKNTTWQIGALIFISDTSNAALRNAEHLLSKVSVARLTFVLLGSNVDSNKLTPFSSNFIYWPNLNQSQPDNWDDAFFDAYACSPPATTLSPPPTTSPASTSAPTSASPVSSSATSSSQTSQTPPSTFSTPLTSISSTLPSSPMTNSAGSSPSSLKPQTSTTSEPYIPCQSWISLGYDDSNTLNANDFKTHINFISSAIGALNYPNRLQVHGAFSDVSFWNNGMTILHMQDLLQTTNQTAIPYNLLQEFATLLTGLNSIENTTWPIGALIFISDTSDKAIANADHLFPRLSKVRLTFVLLGSNVDSTKLTQFSNNFIYWSDLSKPQPDNWDTLSFDAYGCPTTF